MSFFDACFKNTTKTDWFAHLSLFGATRACNAHCGGTLFAEYFKHPHSHRKERWRKSAYFCRMELISGNDLRTGGPLFLVYFKRSMRPKSENAYFCRKIIPPLGLRCLFLSSSLSPSRFLTLFAETGRKNKSLKLEFASRRGKTRDFGR